MGGGERARKVPFSAAAALLLAALGVMTKGDARPLPRSHAAPSSPSPLPRDRHTNLAAVSSRLPGMGEEGSGGGFKKKRRRRRESQDPPAAGGGGEPGGSRAEGKEEALPSRPPGPGEGDSGGGGKKKKKRRRGSQDPTASGDGGGGRAEGMEAGQSKSKKQRRKESLSGDAHGEEGGRAGEPFHKTKKCKDGGAVHNPKGGGGGDGGTPPPTGGAGKSPFAAFFESVKRPKAGGPQVHKADSAAVAMGAGVGKGPRGKEEANRGASKAGGQGSAATAAGDGAGKGAKGAKGAKGGGLGGAGASVGPKAGEGSKGKSGKGKGEVPWHPFDTEYGDHFETGDKAYEDIAPLLRRLAQVSGKDSASLSIYDPYFCAGGVVGRMRALGFGNVHNKNEDCYAVWREGRAPPHDVLVTNPPFSGDHKERCLRHCVQSGRPWAVVLPNYCATKQYFQKITAPCGDGLFYGVPKDMYEFEHPEGTGHQSSPFFSLWFVCFGSHSRAVVDWYRKTVGKEGKGGLRLCTTVRELGENKAVSLEKRMNPRQRKAARKKKMGLA